MEFVKAHGTGNDFVLLPDLDDTMELTGSLTAMLCTPHLGLGADGVIRIAPARAGVDADVFMDYRNADGSLSQMCGNGVRTVAKYVLDRQLLTGDRLRIDTRGGVKVVQVAGRDAHGLVTLVRVDMGIPEPGAVETLQIDAEGNPTEVEVTTVSMGNPHAVVLVEDVPTAPVRTAGPSIATHPRFPEGTNVEFITAEGPARVRGRIWERGVGETLASGTGASAMAVAAHMRGLAGREVDVALPGGVLAIDWSGDRLFVTGPAVEVASGTLDPRWVASLPHPPQQKVRA